MLYSAEVVYQLYIVNNRPHWRQTDDDINVLVSNISESSRWHMQLVHAKAVSHELGYAVFRYLRKTERNSVICCSDRDHLSSFWAVSEHYRVICF